MTGLLACHNCKRRKIKCDRQVPECAFCRERNQKCDYPTEARRPGPKPGTRKKLSLISNSSEKDGPLNQNQQTSGVLPAYPSPSDPLPGQIGTTSPVNSFTGATPESTLLSRMIHPSHETRPPSETDAAGSLIELGAGPGQSNYTRMVSSVCNAFEISPPMFETLLSAYFDNMTAFSIFHRPTFSSKVCSIATPKQLQALLAAMFSFSIRFVPQANFHFTSSSMQHLADQLVLNCVGQCDEDAPPLCVLQAMTLVVFLKLTNGVRGRSWRALGDCIRIAFELRLHQIDQDDAEGVKSATVNSKDLGWTYKEERRRVWWMIWELDVFASTIKCLPIGISWESNHTCLPVEDRLWYSSSPTRSCWLLEDPSLRWKLLEQSGNRSAIAWFIVANSFMLNAQTLSAHIDPGSLKHTQYPESPTARKTTASERMIIENSVSCLSIALPAELAFKQNFLAFNGKSTSDGLASCYADCARYSIHMMIQLSRLMIHRHEVFWHAHRILRSAESEQSKGHAATKDEGSLTTETTMSELRAWNHYLDAANSIVNLVRSSSQTHVQHVNPMLANAIWLAAAAQVLCTVFGPKQTDRRVAESNLDLLRSTFKLYVGLWDIDPSLQERLENLETSLQGLKTRKDAKSSQAHAQAQRTKQSAHGGLNGAPSGVEKPLDGAASPGLHPDALDPMILGNDPAFQTSLFDAFVVADSADGYNPFAIDLDELFAYGYA